MRVLLPVTAVLCAWSVAAQNIATDWIDWERLDAGEVVFQTTAEERGTVTIDVAIEIDAPRQAIWDVLTACEISPEYVPHVRACNRIARVDDGSAELFEQVVKPAFFLPKFDHVFRLDYFPPDRIEVSHVSGPMDRMEGGWRMLERPNGLIALIHRMTVKPGFPVPRMFVRNTLEDDVPGVLIEIRNRAEAAAAE
jgi:uncharacterized protein YndB with AHSA1/START domain